MADEASTDDVQAPEETQDSPEHVEGAPQPETEAGTRADQPDTDTDWEKRFKDTQSSYTQAQQRIAELEQAQAEQSVRDALADPEQQEAAVQHLVDQLGDEGAKQWLETNGYELEDPEEDGDDDEEFRDPRLDSFLEREQKRELDAQVAEAEKGMEKTLDGLCEAESLTLDKETRDLIFDAAVAAPKADGRTPDVEGQFNRFKAALDAQVKAYRQSKRNAPSPPVPGSSGTPNPSLTSTKDRLAAANAIADEAYAGD